MFKEINITFLALWENMPQLYIFEYKDYIINIIYI